MKTFIAILLGCSLALSNGTAAKEAANKKPASKPAPKQKAAHVKAAPHTAPNSHVKAAQRIAPSSHAKVNRPPASANLTKSKTNQSHVSKEQVRKGPNAPANELPAVTNQNNRKIAKVPNKESIERIRAQHRNFKAKPNPAIASAQFNQNYQIAGAQNWSGPQYQVFASYRPQWHDRGWWQSRYSSNLLLIGGGWYFWDSGYWYPAWGYDEAAAYYPYDGPIYVGDNRTPFDQVVADVQATLQEQGYYKGDVDGLMGPLTRQALTDFQRDNGLVTTAALDQPTLSSLGLG
ncbi:MAG: peptidoglycan-binding protein [Chthoniobacterales bacterium]